MDLSCSKEGSRVQAETELKEGGCLLGGSSRVTARRWWILEVTVAIEFTYHDRRYPAEWESMMLGDVRVRKEFELGTKIRSDVDRQML